MNIGKGICFTVLVGFFALAPLSAVSQQHESPQVPEEATLERIDPSDFFTQFQVRNEFRALQDGGEVNLLKPRLDYAFSKTFLIRLGFHWTFLLRLVIYWLILVSS